ncbi:BOX elements [hydrothermal vent metagenome]|uniref:BOX elements n=1 Tax=hydrothermal vent metagenome TaxID=652676 RepID=A0A3B1E5W2_9ZZZZ
MKNTNNYKLLSSDWLLVCNDEFQIIKDGAIVFNEQIIEVGSTKELTKKYYNIKNEYQGINSILMPGLINSHIHLEFSANRTTLKYGNFVQWLFSVISNREQLLEKATKNVIDNELKKMLRNGTTTIGAISSYGFDMESCIQTPINVVYFTEILGSKPEMIDTLLLDFKAKLKSSISITKDNFTSGIAIHAPYSTHPFLIREVLAIAKQQNIAVSAHFQESTAENDWLNYSSGEFELFFKDMLNQHKSLITPSVFLDQFKNIKNLSFTHCIQANKKELKQIKDLNASIIHCPNSNRLLNNSILDLNHTKDIPLAIGTDGLSSNYTLDIFKEIKNALFMHSNIEPNQLSSKLLLASTNGGAKALGFKKGILEKDFDADIISFTLPDNCQTKEDLAIAIILNTKEIQTIHIKGKLIETT